MKQLISKTSAMLLLICLLVSSVNVQAADVVVKSEKYIKAETTYKNWLNKQSHSAWINRYEIADIDGNGIPELMVTGYAFDAASTVYTYDTRTSKMKKLVSAYLGRSSNGLFYNPAKKMFYLVSSTTADIIYTVYKYSDGKLTKIDKYSWHVDKMSVKWKTTYKISGKKYTRAKWNSKWKKASKGYRQLKNTF